ncbi:MAG TPA: glycoside hydrolase family 2 TIM barrel-domain containing protein [Candidatus Saccharimonadales bacterium]|nr:glycoside hydrolase family 2 TIM barrel-domain containing protein [Candidatus Saccharimonadales bacterium]
MRKCIAFLPLLFLALSLFAKTPTAVPVQVKRISDGWVLLRDGRPYYINGVGGVGNLELASQLGANSIRTWGADSLESDNLLAHTQKLGLTIAAGLGLGHERHGFSYADPAQVKRQFDETIAAVEKFKNEPSILVWGIGNEMEADGSNPAIWKAINDIAREIHRRDPNHPTMTVIAGAGEHNIKLKQFMAYCPDVDILGINTYGGIATLLEDVRATQLDRPYIVTEFGPIGWWERPKTAWDAPLESTSTEKAETYRNGYEHSIKGAGHLAFGSYAFIWGNKQERTHTWFGLLVPDGKGGVEKTAAVDALSYEWTGGKWPANRAPRISPIETAAALKQVPPFSEWTATAYAKDADGDVPRYEWEVREETSDPREGGDAEAIPPTHPEGIVKATGPSVTFRAPQHPGAYRLFLAVHDGHGSVATANVPFYVKAN